MSYSTSLVRNNPSAPTGHLPASGETSPDDDGIREDGSWADAAGAEPPSSESAEAGSDAEAVCRTMADGLRAMPPMPVPEPLARPGKRELDAARRLIARHGMPLVLAVAEWVSLPPSKTDKGDASGKPYDGFWRRTLTGPRSLARHWDQVCLQMADDPHGRRLLAEHGILADKGETAQPPSAESTPKVPNYGIPDNLDRRVWKLLDPYDFDAGNDGFEAPRTLRRLLKRVPANDAEGERNAVLEALRAGRRDRAGVRPFRLHRRPWAEGGAGMFLKGECADFPDSWSDRMWGPDDLPNQRTQYELRRAAVRICEACPVRAECLAFGIMVRDQYGIYGGLPLRARRQVLKTAREAGFRFDPDDPTAERRLARYIRANPEIVAAARERECKRRKTEQRNARQQRWRATTRSTGKAKAPTAATHTPPLQDTLF